jgi:hypothetical protein
MKKSFLKTASTNTTTIVDSETGEVIGSSVNKVTYIANDKDEFYLMYASMVLILKSSSDVKMKLFAALLDRYSQGQEFAMSKSLKDIIAQETDCKPRSFDSAFTFLLKEKIVFRVATNLYKINPRHVFQGSTAERNKALKATLELHCPDC